MVGGAVDLVTGPPEVGLQTDGGAAVVTTALTAWTLGVVAALVLTVTAVGAGADSRTAARLRLCRGGEVWKNQTWLGRVRSGCAGLDSKACM